MEPNPFSRGLREKTPLTLMKAQSMGAGGPRSRYGESGKHDEGAAGDGVFGRKADASAVATRLQPRFNAANAPPRTPASHAKNIGASATKQTAQKPGLSALSVVHEAAPSSPRGSVNMSPRGSVMSLDFGDEHDGEGESVQVFVRVRPHNQLEEQRQGLDPQAAVSSVHLRGTREITCQVPGREPQSFTFDQILWQTSQLEVFEVAGMPMVENCMAGYNSSIFAYGQTGAGKTHTMTGMVVPTGDAPSEQRGIAPRVFEYLFERISREEDAKGRDSVRYNCRCSFLEIYNETITDLLNPSANGLPIREAEHGCYVEGLTLTPVQNEDDVLMLMRKGAESRHVGETRMNRESSRSHSVFTCIVEKSSKSTADGVTSVIVSRLNLIDLAGSERVASGAMGGSQAQGTHFKEAVHINKSLTTLGRVISELVDAQRQQVKGRHIHIPYRDSRLTFLLQDSLGGNAKTMIIANVSPSTLCSHETMTTLQFVQRAKRIRNKAHINLDVRGDVAVLQKEIARLNKTISDMRQNNTEEAFRECEQLRDQLKGATERTAEFEQKLGLLTAEAMRYRRERARMEEKLQLVQKEYVGLEELAARLSSRAECMTQAMEHHALARQQEVEVEAEIDAARTVQLATTQLELQTAQEAHSSVQKELASLQAALRTAEADSARLESLRGVARQELTEAKEAMQSLQAKLAEAETELAQGKATIAELQTELDTLRTALTAVHEQESRLKSRLAAESEVAAGLRRELDAAREEMQARLAAADADKAAAADQLAKAKARAEARERELEEARKAVVAELEAEREAGQVERERVQAEVEGLRAEVEQGLETLRVARDQAEKTAGELEQKATDLQAQLDSERSAHTATQETLTSATQQVADLQQTATSQSEQLAQLQSQLDACRSQLAQEQAAAAELAASLASKHAEADGVSGEAQRLAAQLQAAQVAAEQLISQVQAAQVNGEQLAEQLQAAQALGQSRGEEVAQLQREVGALEERSRGLAAELEGAKQRAVDDAQEHARQVAKLQQELESSQRAVETLGLEMEGMVASLSQDKAALVQSVEAQQAEAKSLGDQLSALQQELERVQQQLDDSCGGAERLEGALGEQRRQAAAVQQQLQQREGELEAAKKELAAAASAASEQSLELTRRDESLAQLKRSMQESEVQAGLSHREQQERLGHLQRELIRSQEQLVAREYELNTQIKQLGSQLEAAGREVSGQARQLEGRAGELLAAKASLTALQETVSTVQGLLSERERELSEARRRASEERDGAQITQAKDKALIEKLSEELDNFRSGRGDMEQQMKCFLVTNTRQTKAFQEIRRLIEWATTPPSSARSSVGVPGADGTPNGPTMHAPIAASTAPGEAGVPRLVSEEDGENATASARGNSPPGSPSRSTTGLSPARAMASLLRLRSSLSLLSQTGHLDEMADGAGGGGGGAGYSPQPSPHFGSGAGLPQSPFMRAKAAGAMRNSPRRRLDGGGSASQSVRTTSELSSMSLSKMAGLGKAGLGAGSPGAAGASAPLVVRGSQEQELDCDICSPRALMEHRDQTCQPGTNV